MVLLEQNFKLLSKNIAIEVGWRKGRRFWFSLYIAAIYEKSQINKTVEFSTTLEPV